MDLNIYSADLNISKTPDEEILINGYIRQSIINCNVYGNSSSYLLYCRIELL